MEPFMFVKSRFSQTLFKALLKLSFVRTQKMKKSLAIVTKAEMVQK
jgi:hypothetical protein